MSAPGWVHPCTCGKVERGAYCPDCRGFGDGFNGGTWEHPRRPDHQPPAVFSSAKQGGPETSAPEPATGKPRESAVTVGGDGWESRGDPSATDSEVFCPGGHRGATVRGNAAYCAECKGRIKPTSSSHYSHGTGH